jgi:hypothetical protein
MRPRPLSWDCNYELRQPSVECIPTPWVSTVEPSDLPHSCFNVDVWTNRGRGCGCSAAKSRTWGPFSCTPAFGSKNTTDRKTAFITDWRLLYRSLPPPDGQPSGPDHKVPVPVTADEPSACSTLPVSPEDLQSILAACGSTVLQLIK